MDGATQQYEMETFEPEEMFDEEPSTLHSNQNKEVKRK